MHIVTNFLEAIRESDRIRVQKAKLISGTRLPAVINEDILKSEVLESVAHEQVDLLHYIRCIHLLAAECVPGGPAHLRRVSKTKIGRCEGLVLRHKHGTSHYSRFFKVLHV